MQYLVRKYLGTNLSVVIVIAKNICYSEYGKKFNDFTILGRYKVIYPGYIKYYGHL